MTNNFEPAEYTGNYIVTFQEDSNENKNFLNEFVDINKLPKTSDYTNGAWKFEDIKSSGGAIYENLGIALIKAEDLKIAKMQEVTESKSQSPIISIEPEMVMHPVQETNMPLSYIQGCRDEIDYLYNRLASNNTMVSENVLTKEIYNDTHQMTWGLQATNVINSKYSGKGIKIAVLDTGMDLQHADFRERKIVSHSFIQNETVQDVAGHGTHCIGTACGNTSSFGQRYGIAYESDIYVGKVLSNSGFGTDGDILAGIDWAVSNHCHIISMSLGSNVQTVSTAYEVAGQRALKHGCLIIAAAGNNADRLNGNYGFVGRPANSKSIMAVAALDNQLNIANFSARSGNVVGGEIDIAAPGVNIISSWPNGYYAISGTSMATPHVSGIAALFAEAYQASGYQLWQMLITNARKLPASSIDIGVGIVQAPVTQAPSFHEFFKS